MYILSCVYKYILGESRSNLLEGMTSSKTHESEFILAKDRGMWSGEGPNEYTCRDNPKRNTTGNNGDYDRYCIFDKEIDAQNHCKSEDRCVGYISNQARNMFTATAKPVPNPGANGRHYEKRKIPASEPRLSFQKLDNTLDDLLDDGDDGDDGDASSSSISTNSKSLSSLVLYHALFLIPS